MSPEALTAPTHTSVDFTYYFGMMADALDWGSCPWVTLGAHLDAHQTPFESIKMGDIVRAISATRSAHPEVTGTLVNRLIGTDDVSRRELFRVVRQLLRIYDLRIVELLELVDILERCPGKVEDLTIRNLLALISLVDLDAEPQAPAPVAQALDQAATRIH
jgi:hypothetical protein